MHSSNIPLLCAGSIFTTVHIERERQAVVSFFRLQMSTLLVIKNYSEFLADVKQT